MSADAAGLRPGPLIAAAAGPAPDPVPQFQRSTGEVRVVLGDRDGVPQVRTLYQSGSGKLRFPRVPAGVEAMVLNTSGGLAEGDRFRSSSAAEAHVLTVSTQACERVYRSGGGPARVEQIIRVGPGATLNHLPQPTILFERAALARRTSVDVAAGGRLTLCEGLVLGRAAMGESVRTAHVHDRVDLTIDGRLAFVDALRLDPAALARQGPAGLAGSRGIGLVLHVGDAAALARLREVLAEVDGRAGATLVNGVVVARILAPTHDRLQDALAKAVTVLTGAAPPRSWAL